MSVARGALLVVMALLCAAPAGGQVTVATGVGAGMATASGDATRGPWDEGVVLVGRLGRGVGTRGAATLLVDYQAFAAGDADGLGRYRALFVMPSMALVRDQGTFRLGVGAVRRIPVDGGVDGSWKLAVGAQASRQVAGAWALELGWRLNGTEVGSRHTLYYLSLVRSWGVRGRA